MTVLVVVLVCLAFSELVHSHPLQDNSKDEWCNGWKNPVCGSDGITYWNECLFYKTADRLPDLTEVQKGICPTPDCSDCEEEEEEHPVSYRVCTSNNVLLNSSCMFKCYKEEYPLITENHAGCISDSPTSEEVEISTSAQILKLLEEYLQQSLTLLSNSKVKLTLDKISGNLLTNNTLYSVMAKRGIAEPVHSFTSPDYFSLSAEHEGRVRFRVQAPTITARYRDFSILTGRTRMSAALGVSVFNSTLELIGDLQSRGGCSRFEPASFLVADMPPVEVKTSNVLPEDLAKGGLNGFLKESLVAKINQALQTTVLPEMYRVGCLDWSPQDRSSCIGAFQRKFCPTARKEGTSQFREEETEGRAEPEDLAEEEETDAATSAPDP